MKRNFSSAWVTVKGTRGLSGARVLIGLAGHRPAFQVMTTVKAPRKGQREEEELETGGVFSCLIVIFPRIPRHRFSLWEKKN